MTNPANNGKPAKKTTSAKTKALISSSTEQALLEQIRVLQLRTQALEEFFVNFITVLEGSQRRGFTSEHMNDWLDTCPLRMAQTQSAIAQEIAALKRLQKLVLQ